MATRILLALTLLAAGMPASAWSGKGHQVVALVAKWHLSSDARAALDDLLDGSSIVYYASWLDQVVADAEYSYTSTWHYINVDPWETLETRSSLAFTDAVTALHEQSGVLRSATATRDERVLAAKALIHLVGDLHQPLHCGHGSDRGGNTVKLTYNGSSTNLHSLWDYHLVNDAHPWSYYEWASYLDCFTPEGVEELSAGTVDDWARESISAAALVYDAFPQGYAATTADAAAWTPTIERQLGRAGLRLAALLNSVFGASAIIPAEDGGDDTEPEVVFTLQGVRVDGPAAPGIYVTSRHRKLAVTR